MSRFGPSPCGWGEGAEVDAEDHLRFGIADKNRPTEAVTDVAVFENVDGYPGRSMRLEIPARVERVDDERVAWIDLDNRWVVARKAAADCLRSRPQGVTSHAVNVARRRRRGAADNARTRAISDRVDLGIQRSNMLHVR